jgi:hypothetical protein
MRDTIDVIDTAAKTDEQREIAYALLAEHIAAQALALAAYEGQHIHPDYCHDWITRAAADPSVFERRASERSVPIGVRAMERLRVILASDLAT